MTRTALPSPSNIALWSEVFSSWTLGAVTVTDNQSANPLTGASTADLLTEDNTNALHRVFQAIPGGTDDSFTFSVFARMVTRRYLRLYMSISSGDMSALFDLQAGTVMTPSAATDVGSFYARIIDMGSGWYRLSLSTKQFVPQLSFAQILMSDGTATLAYLGDGVSAIELFGAQLNRGGGPIQYTATTNATVNASGVHRMLASGRSSIPTRQNLLQYSQQLATLPWLTAAYPSTVTENALTAPDGTSTANLIEAPNGGGANLHGTVQIVSNFAAVPRVVTVSVYAKAGTTSWLEIADVQHTARFYRVWFDLANGEVGTEENATGTITDARLTHPGAAAGWYKCSMTYTFPSDDGAPTVGGYIIQPTPADATQSYVGASESIYAWQAQVTTSNHTGPDVVTTNAAVDTGTMRFLIPTRQNLVTLPNAIDSWTLAQLTVTADADAGPSAATLRSIDADVTSLALDGLIPSVVNTGHSATLASFDTYWTGRYYTMSAILKAGNLYGVVLSFANGANGAYFDLQNGTVGTTLNTTASIVEIEDGIYRATISGEMPAGGAANAAVYLASANGVTAFAGDGLTIGAYMGGVQVTTSNRAGPLTVAGAPLTPAIRSIP